MDLSTTPPSREVSREALETPQTISTDVLREKYLKSGETDVQALY